MSHPDFTLLRQTRINSLNLTIEDYRHRVTNARHLHLSADDDNNVFLVAFLTVPEDSTGVAHILEHTTLCGSQRYPIRDPFFMMTRRSLNTFMNAFTSSDWTAYPFASKNVKDFNNLLDVYLDAVFFPNLTELDFAQEGHRIEFATPDDSSTPLVYKGVVYNEMKGAMSSPIQTLMYTVHNHLFPTITYHHNSGGDPQEIPNLTHAQLREFHATHYHPSNAIFMTYGNRPAIEHQQVFETCALSRFTALDIKLQIPDEQRYSAPQQIVSHYALDEQEGTQDKTHIVLAWLLGHSTDTRQVLTNSLLAGVLLDNSASPLRHALESTPLGAGLSPLCGFDDNTRESSFMCGLEGSNPEHAEAVEALILQVLTDVANNGVPQSQVESVLHQIELSQREISGDGLPYGLHLLLNVLTPTIHGGDPIAALDIDPLLTQLRADCQHPEFIPQLVKTLLLDNPHRIRVVMMPDTTLAAQRTAAEIAKLAKLKAILSETDKTQLITQSAALQARQAAVEDVEILPKVTLQDIPAELHVPESTTAPLESLSEPVEDKLSERAVLPTTWFARGTNGMVYQAVVLDLPDIEEDLLDILPLFCDCLTEVGCLDKDYLETAAWQAAVSGGIHARLSVRGSVADFQKIRGIFSLSGKALVRNHAKLADLLQKTLEHVHFDELPRLQELIAQYRTGNDSNITDRGHHLAMAACTSGISPTGALSHRWYGVAGLHQLRALDDSLEDDTALAEFAHKLQRVRDCLLNATPQLVVVSEAAAQREIAEALTTCWQAFPQPVKGNSIFNMPVTYQLVKQAWSTSTQVNFCAKAYSTVPSGHPDAPALVVLGDFLRNGYLHRAIREQGGAYGSGASYMGDSGAFRFYSYRDPRLQETLADFDRSLDWLHTTLHSLQALEEAILGVISRIDKPGSPAGEALNTFFNTLHGRTPEQRREFRSRVLQVQLSDLQRVTATYLQPERASIAVLSNAQTLAKLPELGLEVQLL